LRASTHNSKAANQRREDAETRIIMVLETKSETIQRSAADRKLQVAKQNANKNIQGGFQASGGVSTEQKSGDAILSLVVPTDTQNWKIAKFPQFPRKITPTQLNVFLLSVFQN
jgi:hypothetical protein